MFILAVNPFCSFYSPKPNAMKDLLLSFAMIFMVLLFSCKKEEPVNPVPETKSEYLNLNIGSYWVYEHYKIDSMGHETKESMIDSVLISRDTVINNQVYYVLEGNSFLGGSQWKIQDCIRDSSKCLVSSSGQVLFSETNFTDTINKIISCLDQTDTIFTIYTVMEDPGHQVSVPAGSFEVLNAKSYLSMYYPFLNPPGSPRHLIVNRFFGRGVGEISRTYCYHQMYYESGTYYERRLVRYHRAE